MRTLVSLLVALAVAGEANAIQLRTSVMSIYQVSNGPLVKLGHVVHASTNYNRLSAGGTFAAVCAHSQLNWPITGGRSMYTENLVGGLRLDVTIPEQLPAYRNMPGFSSLPRGTTVYCNYNWTSVAVEGTLSVGAGGIVIPAGGGSLNANDSEPFIMNVPGTTDPNENSVCIP